MVELFDSLSGQTRFAQYLVTFCSRLEVASDVISSRFVRPISLDECVKFPAPSLNHSLQIPPKAVGGGIFDFRCNFRPEVENDATFEELISCQTNEHDEPYPN